MTVKEAARALEVSTRRIHQLVEENRLEAEKIGRDTFVSNRSVEAVRRQPRHPGRPRKEK